MYIHLDLQKLQIIHLIILFEKEFALALDILTSTLCIIHTSTVLHFMDCPIYKW